MDDTQEVIRERMEETKSNLTEKMESLEHQVSKTVQSTGTAVNATVAAVQKTVDSVTGAVQGAAHSVTIAFDVRRQINRHPWLFVGGSVALGYLAFEFLKGSAKKSEQPPDTVPPPIPLAEKIRQSNGEPTPELTTASAATEAANKSRLSNSSWHELRGVAIGALIGIVESVASRAVPQVMDYLTGHRVGATGNNESNGKEKQH